MSRREPLLVKKLRNGAIEALKSLVGDVDKAGLARLFSLKADFPSEWHQFVTGKQDFTATIKKDYFPYFVQGREVTIAAIELYASQGNDLAGGIPAGLNTETLSQALNKDGSLILTLHEDTILKRQKDARVFLVIRYHAA